MDTFENLRSLIKENKIDEVISYFIGNDIGISKDTIYLIGNEWTDWKNKEINGLDANKDERQKIVFRLLKLISTAEKNASEGVKRVRAERLLEIEEVIERTYNDLNNIKKRMESIAGKNSVLGAKVDMLESKLQKLEKVHSSLLTHTGINISTLTLPYFISTATSLNPDSDSEGDTNSENEDIDEIIDLQDDALDANDIDFEDDNLF